MLARRSRGGFVRWYVKGNLIENSVYYAIHIEHAKGTHPDFAMVIDNMNTIKQPKVDKVVYRPESGKEGAFRGRVYIYNEAYSVDGKTPELYMGMVMMMMPISILIIEG